MRSLWLAPLVVVALGVQAAAADPALERRFVETVQPFFKNYCHGCHGEKKHEAKLDLSRYDSASAVAKNERIFGLVMERLEAGEMPPAKAPKHPTAHERRAVLDWLREARENEARRNAGDPGRVLARRLNNAEFDNTISDLTGVDIRPTREFPIDPANEAGFDNSGESLAMSPALLKKYLAAARFVADHLVLKPEGFVFAPFPAVTDTDRDKYCVQRIVDFYHRHPVDYADYFLAAWRFQHRDALGKPKAALADFAHEEHLSPKYLTTIWSALHDEKETAGPLGEVKKEWQKLPADLKQPGDLRKECERLRDLVIRLRKDLTPKAEELHAEGVSNGSQPFVLWRNRWIAANHMSYLGKAQAADAAAFATFCRVFPDTFAVIERAPYYDKSTNPKGRRLSAGFHLMQGYFRDDAALCELVLSDAERREIDTLWNELHFVSRDPMRQYKDFIFFERAEPPQFIKEAAFDFARSEDKDAISEAKIKQLCETYLAKARKIGCNDKAIEAIETYFNEINAQIRAVEKARLAAEPSHLATLLQFATRAYRRPLSDAERDGLLAFYRKLRGEEQLSHEDAIRDTLASILLSPKFCYLTLAAPSENKGAAAPLSDYALASRLSYFLWASMPDTELLARAAKGDLHHPEVLVAQARRMLRDPKVRGFADQFAGNWLEFRRFEESNTVDRTRFPAFTNELRAAMAEEPIRFFMHVVQQNRPVLDFLDADYVIVNSVLAKHYGMRFATSRPSPPASGREDNLANSLGGGRGDGGEGNSPSNDWRLIAHAHEYNRGGFPPMALFLTKNSPGLRTSPVKRGYWVVRRLLGENIPPPPPSVPELPKDEAKLGEQTLPQLLARHRADQACAGCHQRFDSIGLAFEGFGPIGEVRTKDLGGRPIQAAAAYPDGAERTGLDGLRDYLSKKRQNDFIDNLCRKLFAYALGRTLLLSDNPTIEAMRTKLASDSYRFESLIESIVTSKQFLNRRGRDDGKE